MSDEELRSAYNEIALTTTVGLQWYSDELARRAVNRQTRTLVWLTWAIAFLGVVSTAGVLLALFN